MYINPKGMIDMLVIDCHVWGMHMGITRWIGKKIGEY
jgi:hypothetical protein